MPINHTSGFSKYGLSRRMNIGLLLAMALGSVCNIAFALPAKVIVLRHGEKAKSPDNYGLCSIGWSRSLALVNQYLGKGAVAPLLPPKGPAGIFSITPHSFELISPVATSWGLPQTSYSSVQLPGESEQHFTESLNVRTQQAARDVMTNPRWNNQVVVMAWEHKHIANKSLEESYPGQEVTLRQLLNLDQARFAASVPTTWPSETYDYFWIVTYGKRNSKIPTQFEMVQQEFVPPFQSVPSNAWGQPEDLSGTDCSH
jgi:hypothetical protein